MRLKKTLKLDKLDFYKKHISIINALFISDKNKLSVREIELLSLFIYNTEGIPEDYTFATVTRNKVMAAMGISHGGLSNYLNQLRNKGVVQKDRIIKALYPMTAKEQEYQIKLEVSGN
jgi:hypothetical protein